MKSYPDYLTELGEQIRKLRKGVPETMAAYAQLHKATTAPGVLDKKTKELIALGIGVAIRCDGCIAYHVRDALRAGATREEILETIGVSVLMGGGPAVMSGAEAVAAMEQFETVAHT
jgi:AhpD family alkylhydroperoxidase